MAKYKIGITEAGDAGLDLSWAKKLDSVDGAILITKQATPGFQQLVLENKKKFIVHATVTGYGGTVLEPNVPPYAEELAAVESLVSYGFPREKVVIRVDPIIPTEKGLKRAEDVFLAAMDMGFARYRVSVIDMYPHVRVRFQTCGLPLPYGNSMFAGRESLEAIDELLSEMENAWRDMGHQSADLRIESCAEPYLYEPIPCGCISEMDLRLLGLDTSDVDSLGAQRTHCMCYSGKTELLRHRHPCKHNCLYCYWKW